MSNDYADLSKLIRDAGLLDRQYGYYISKIIITLDLLALVVLMLLIFDNLALKLLSAVFLAFVHVQTGFIFHDIGHEQVFKSKLKHKVAGFIAGNILLGISRGYWVNKHNAHHSKPNQIDGDPDVEIPVVAMNTEQAISKRGIQRFMVKYQAFLFVLVWLITGFSIRISSIIYLIKHKVENRLLDIFLMGAHFIIYPVLVFAVLPGWPAVLFIVIHQAVAGLYMTSVFAPNHKGMPVLDKNTKLEFLQQQILTARNVRAGSLTDAWYGGLNYQIEHHLFPNMPRNNFGKAQKIIKAFCKERGIRYYETSIVQSYKEIFIFLHEISAVVRKPKTTTYKDASAS